MRESSSATATITRRTDARVLELAQRLRHHARLGPARRLERPNSSAPENGLYSVELPPESRRRKVEDGKRPVGEPLKYSTAVRNQVNVFVNTQARVFWRFRGAAASCR